MTLRLPLARNYHMLIISAHVQTLPAEEEVTDGFYEDLHTILQTANARDKIALLGDFNATVGRISDLWDGVIGSHGVGKMNANDFRLLSICSEYNLVFTNTIFRQKNIHKTSWMYPRSRQWHLLDYVIVKKNQMREVKKTEQCEELIAGQIIE